MPACACASETEKDNGKCLSVCAAWKRAVLQPAFNLVYAIPP